MFGWLFPPTCPVDAAAKGWIEERLQWLTQEFGEELGYEFRVIEPTPEFFPDPYDGSRKAVRCLFARVCEYMGVVPETIKLKFFKEPRNLWLVNEKGDWLPHAAGLYEGPTIRLAEDELGEPMPLIGTMAHELSHFRLLGEGRAMGEAFDNELLTDLTAVVLGFGIFLANVPRHWDSGYTLWPGTQLKKPEYLTPPMFGYALAHLAWFREERKPAWARHLNMEARANLKQGLRYLWETGDSAFRPRHARRQSNEPA
ncbi:MAG: hypothetical protein L0Z62_47635 [Gemmataceae bacterium]|nr:hypothetical protein [Gemmataceae bacterium]